MSMDKENTNCDLVHFSIIEPGGVQTNYATSSAVNIPSHPAYAAPDTPARILHAYVENPEARKNWAAPDAVASAMYEVASRPTEFPLRVPLGPDAWGMMKSEIKNIDEDLDKLKAFSQRVGHEDQLGSIDFLKRKD